MGVHACVHEWWVCAFVLCLPLKYLMASDFEYYAVYYTVY